MSDKRLTRPTPCVAERAGPREVVAVLSGTFLSNIGLAVGDFAQRSGRLFVASEPLSDKVTWKRQTRYHVPPGASTYMQTTMLVPEAAKLNKKRWGIVCLNHETRANPLPTSFKAADRRRNRPAAWSLSSSSAAWRRLMLAVTQALLDAKVDAIFNVTFGNRSHRSSCAKAIRASLFAGSPGGEPALGRARSIWTR